MKKQQFHEIAIHRHFTESPMSDKKVVCLYQKVLNLNKSACIGLKYQCDHNWQFVLRSHWHVIDDGDSFLGPR